MTKDEIKRSEACLINEIRDVLLAHQPIIDVPFEVISEIAVALVKEGYGNISGYKAEIERLKAEFKQLETNAEILARGVRDLNHENYELTEKMKQAQIDVLNKVKNCREATDSDCYPYIWCIVNKVLDEVKGK